MSGWSIANNTKADSQGWAIFCTQGAHGHPPYEIQRIDDPEDGSPPIFAGDQEAHEFVRRRAEEGDSLALAALEFLKRESPEEHATIINSKHEGWG